MSCLSNVSTWICVLGTAGQSVIREEKHKKCDKLQCVMCSLSSLGRRDVF